MYPCCERTRQNLLPAVNVGTIRWLSLVRKVCVIEVNVALLETWTTYPSC